jgi:hypothetical protein
MDAVLSEYNKLRAKLKVARKALEPFAVAHMHSGDAMEPPCVNCAARRALDRIKGTP